MEKEKEVEKEEELKSDFAAMSDVDAEGEVDEGEFARTSNVKVEQIEVENDLEKIEENVELEHKEMGKEFDEKVDEGQPPTIIDLEADKEKKGEKEKGKGTTNQ